MTCSSWRFSSSRPRPERWASNPVSRPPSVWYVTVFSFSSFSCPSSPVFSTMLISTSAAFLGAGFWYCFNKRAISASLFLAFSSTSVSLSLPSSSKMMKWPSLAAWGVGRSLALMTDPSAFWCTRTAPSESRRPSCAGHRDAWQFDGSRWPGPESKRTGPRPTHQKTLGSSEEDRHHQLSSHWAYDSRRRGGFPRLSCGRWPLVQHTDCGFRRWHSVPADPWCALGPPAVGVEVCVCTAGPQEWSLWCGVDGGQLLCSPGLACPWWSQQHALSAILWSRGAILL